MEPLGQDDGRLEVHGEPVVPEEIGAQENGQAARLLAPEGIVFHKGLDRLEKLFHLGRPAAAGHEPVFRFLEEILEPDGVLLDLRAGIVRGHVDAQARRLPLLDEKPQFVFGKLVHKPSINLWFGCPPPAYPFGASRPARTARAASVRSVMIPSIRSSSRSRLICSVSFTVQTAIFFPDRLMRSSGLPSARLRAGSSQSVSPSRMAVVRAPSSLKIKPVLTPARHCLTLARQPAWKELTMKSPSARLRPASRMISLS